MSSELRSQTAGESHGPGGVVIISGLPAGLAIDQEFINSELTRRQGGYGRGARQRIEQDRVTCLSGLRQGVTLGSPLTFLIPNKDARLDDPQKTPPVHRPRPGHADLAGSLKYLTTDCRGTLERASARETAARVAAGAVARLFLRRFSIETFSFVRSIGEVETDFTLTLPDGNLAALRAARDGSEVNCPDPSASAAMIDRIHAAMRDKDTVGGVIETHVFNCPPGLGSCMHWDEKLDARIAFAVMSVQAIKGVEIGLGFDSGRRPGSQVHDPIALDPGQRSGNSLGFTRPTNNAGGLEGGMTNGQSIVVRAAMKPIATLLQGLPSIDLTTLQPATSQYERSDICAVPAASVVLEHVIAFEVARAFRAKFSGDSMQEVIAQVQAYQSAARDLFR